MSQTNSSIIKPSASGTTILQEEAGGAAVTIDAAGDVQIANSLTAGKLGPNVVVPQATTKRVHRYTAKGMHFEDVSNAGNQYWFLFGTFQPLSHLNSFWCECSVPIRGLGNDHTCNGLSFNRHGGGSDVTVMGKGYSYADVNWPTYGMSTMTQYCGIAASTFGNGDKYNVYWRSGSAGGNSPSRFFIDGESDSRLATATEAHLVIYEYKNYQ